MISIGRKGGQQQRDRRAKRRRLTEMEKEKSRWGEERKRDTQRDFARERQKETWRLTEGGRDFKPKLSQIQYFRY